MRVACKICALGCLAALLSLNACLSSGPKDRAQLEIPLPQFYFLPYPPDRVWEVLLTEATISGRTTLVEDHDTRLLSWISDLDQDSESHSSLSDYKAGSRKETITITQLRIEAAREGCRLTIRQMYYPLSSPASISASRGNYEQKLLRRLRQALVVKSEQNDG